MALFTATPARRRLVMIALLALGVAGAVVRQSAANPSTLRDIGTLLMVLWVPVVGNLIAWLVRKMPRKPRPATDFAAGAPFTPHLRVEIAALDLPPDVAAAVDPAERRCLVIARRRGFMARLRAPLAQALGTAAVQALEIELLHPAAGLPELLPGTDIQLSTRTTVVGKGRILEAMPVGATPAALLH